MMQVRHRRVRPSLVLNNVLLAAFAVEETGALPALQTFAIAR